MNLVELYNKEKHKKKHPIDEWIDLLCRYGSKEEFIDIFKETRNFTLAIMKYRKILYDRGFGNIPYMLLYQAYIQQNYNILHKLLQELFLEYIPKDQFQFILNKLKQRKENLAILYQKHLDNKQRRILNIILTL